MNEEELRKTVEELSERLEGIQVDLTQKPDGLNSSIFQSADGERQMIVHWIDSSLYEANDGEAPESKQEAEELFLEAVKKNKTKDDRYIVHGDLMVADGNPCNYYAYVASVDRKTGGAGYQSEDPGDRAVSEEYPKGAPDWVNREIVIWTETYPGKGMSEEIEYTAVSVTSQSTTTIILPQLTWTFDEYPKKEFDLFKYKQTPKPEMYETVDCSSVIPSTPVSLAACEFVTRDIDLSTTDVSIANFKFSEVKVEQPYEDSNTVDKKNFEFDTHQLQEPIYNNSFPLVSLNSSYVSILATDLGKVVDTTIPDLTFSKVGSEQTTVANLITPSDPVYKQGKNFKAVGDMSMTLNCTEGSTDSVEITKDLSEVITNTKSGTEHIDILSADLSSSTTSKTSSSYTGSKLPVVTHVSVYTEKFGYPVPEDKRDFLTSIDSLNFSSGSKTPEGSMEIVTKGDKTSDGSKSFALFETVAGGDDCGCLKIKHSGNLTKETYDSQKKKVSIFSTPQTFDLYGKTTEIDVSQQPTKVVTKLSRNYSQAKNEVYKVNLEASLERLSISDLSIKNTLKYEARELNTNPVTFGYNFQWKDYPVEEERNTYSWEGKKLTIKTQKATNSGYEKTFKATKAMFEYYTETRKDTLKPYDVTLKWQNGKKVKVKSSIVDFLFKQNEFNYDIKKIDVILSDKKIISLTPTEYALMISDSKTFNIKSKPTLQEYTDAYRLGLLRKEYDFKQNLFTAEFQPSTMTLNSKSTILQADPCTTISATSGGSSTQTVPMLQGSLTPLRQDEFDINSLKIEEEEKDYVSIYACDVSIGTGTLGKGIDIEWTGVKVSCYSPPDGEYLGGGEHSDTSAKTVSIYSNNFTASGDEDYQKVSMHRTVLEGTPASDRTVSLSSVEYYKGDKTTDSDSFNIITDLTVSLGTYISRPADTLSIHTESYGDYPDLVASKVSIGDYLSQNVYGDCTSSWVSLGTVSTKYADTVYDGLTHVSIGTSPSADSYFNLNLQAFDIAQSADSTEVKKNGLDLPVITFGTESSSKALVTGGSGPNITSLNVTEPEDSTVDELEVEVLSDSSTHGYIPILEKDPVCQDTIYAWDETAGSNSIDCSIGSTGLYITQTVRVQQWDVQCGVISDKPTQTTNRPLPSIQLGVEAIYKESITFCEYDSSGNATQKTIDVLTTTAPSSGSADPDGYMLSGDCL